jgi:uncharacterized membrane protein YeaQ/YmgE (transglycosylase-associated protein family)
VSLLIWIGVGALVGYAATRSRAAWDRRGPHGFLGAGIAGALVGGLLAVAAGLGSIIAFTPSSLFAALLFAVLAVTVYQTALGSAADQAGLPGPDGDSDR